MISPPGRMEWQGSSSAESRYVDMEEYVARSMVLNLCFLVSRILKSEMLCRTRVRKPTKGSFSNRSRSQQRLSFSTVSSHSARFSTPTTCFQNNIGVDVKELERHCSDMKLWARKWMGRGAAPLPAHQEVCEHLEARLWSIKSYSEWIIQRLSPLCS